LIFIKKYVIILKKDIFWPIQEEIGEKTKEIGQTKEKNREFLRKIYWIFIKKYGIIKMKSLDSLNLRLYHQIYAVLRRPIYNDAYHRRLE